jgi:hypothetical protein
MVGLYAFRLDKERPGPLMYLVVIQSGRRRATVFRGRSRTTAFRSRPLHPGFRQPGPYETRQSS